MRWLLSRERGLDALDPSTRRVRLDPWGEVPPLAELVGLYPTRASAAAVVIEAGGGDAEFWRIKPGRGWGSWTADDDDTWTRWRLLPLESGLDLSPVPPSVDAEWVLGEHEALGLPADPLAAAAAGDPVAMRRAVLEHGRRVALADGDLALADDCTVELTRLDVEEGGDR